MAKTNTKRSRGINGDDPIPSSPSRPPIANIWLKFGEGLDRMQIHGFCTRWATYEALLIAINDREYKLVDKDMGWYETEDELLRFRLMGDVEDLLEEQPRRDWVPPEPMLSQLRQAAGLVKTPDTPHKPLDNEVRERNRTRTKTRAPVSRDGLVSIGDICDELGMNPRDARKILRNKVEKPDAGWAWTPKEAEAIKKILKA
jgi:hypothetical protein